MPTITDLQYQKKNKNRVNIYVDNVFFAGANLESVLKFGLKKGLEINEKKLDDFLFDDEKQVAFQKTIDLVSRFAKTEYQLLTYLKQKGYSEKTCNFVMDKLKEYKMIDDKQFIDSYISFKKNVCGINKIKQELIKKGIDKSLIDYVDEVLKSGDNCCEDVALKYIKNKEINDKTRNQLFRHLVSKGFDYADIKMVVDKIIKGNDDESWN